MNNMYKTNYNLVFNGNKNSYTFLRKVFLIASIALNFLAFLFFISVWKYILHIIPLMLFPVISVLLRHFSARLGFDVKIEILKDYIVIKKIYSFSEKIFLKLKYNQFTIKENISTENKSIINNKNLSDGFKEYNIFYQENEYIIYLDNYAFSLIIEYIKENVGDNDIL